MPCNIASVCRMAVLVAFAIAQIAMAAPATRDAWDTVVEAAEASPQQLPVQSLTRSSDLYSGSSPSAVTPQQVQSAQQLAALHDEQDQPEAAAIATSAQTTTQTTYQLCAAAYPALVPKPVAPSSPINYGPAANATTPTTQCSALAQNWVSTCNQCQLNPASSTNCQNADLASICSNARAQCNGSGSGATPAAPVNPTTFVGCDANKMNYYNVCNLCQTMPNATMCQAFHPGTGECAAIKAACPNYTPVTPQGYVPSTGPVSTCTKEAQQWLVVCNSCKANANQDQCKRNSNWPTVCPNVWKMCAAASSRRRQAAGTGAAVDPVLTPTTVTPTTATGGSGTPLYTQASTGSTATGTTGTQSGTSVSTTPTAPGVTTTTTNQPQQPTINALLCQQVLNAPGAASAAAKSPAVASTPGTPAVAGGVQTPAPAVAATSTTGQKAVVLGM